jgi:membrane fusion protein, multidrug efflux system
MVVIVLDKRREAEQMRLAICTMWLFLGFALPAYAQQAAPSAIPVGTVSAERKPIEKTLGFVRRVEARERVDIKARVTGYLEAVLFKEGDTVETGDPLYLIEKEPFQAAVKQAEGALERGKAAKVLTEVQLQRAVELLAKNVGTVVTRDQALTADEKAKATIATAEANLEAASINLGYTDITSPITGKIGRTKVTKGNVVSPESGTLTTIVSQDPMYVVFPVSQREFLRAQKASVQPDVSNIKIRLRLVSKRSVFSSLQAACR